MKLPKNKNIIIYIISLLIPFVLTVLSYLLSIIASSIAIALNNGKNDPSFVLTMFLPYLTFLISPLIPLITYSILHLIQIYRMWDVINDGQTRATPGKAIGFGFIPFYNLYWIFNIWGGFPTDYNAFVERYRLTQKVPLLSPTIYQLFPVLVLSTFLIITVPVLMIYFAFLLHSSNKAIDSLKTAATETRQQFAQQQSANLVFQPQIILR